MLSDFVRRAGMNRFASLVSPAFFEVLPRNILWTEGRRLLQNRRDRDGFERTAARIGSRLRAHDVPVDLAYERTNEAQPPEDARSYGENVVTLYFHQIWFSEHAILDLRAQALHERSSRLTWRPARWWTRWDDDFIVPLRNVYAGFYQERDDRFHAGLSELGLEDAADLFRNQFGDDPHAARFDLDHFFATFDDVFELCRDRDIALPAGFLPLGIALATMFDNLDRLDVRLDVKRCFLAATSDGAEVH